MYIKVSEVGGRDWFWERGAITLSRKLFVGDWSIFPMELDTELSLPLAVLHSLVPLFLLPPCPFFISQFLPPPLFLSL